MTNETTTDDDPILVVAEEMSEQSPSANKVEVQSAKSGWLFWGNKGALTLTDQGLIGGSNFLIGILLARQLLPAQYGAYALAFEVFMVISLAYSCLILEPMLVFGPSTYKDSFKKYFGVLLWMHLAVALITAVLLGGSAWIAARLGESAGLPTALVGATIAAPCVLLFWLARRAFYVRLDPKTSVLGGLIYGGVLLTGTLTLYELRLLSAFLTFILMAAGAVAASLILLSRLKPTMALRPTSPTLREVSGRHWSYGRWALAASVAAWVSGNIYYVFLSGMRGLAATGYFRALQNLASPIGQVFSALALLALPYAARAYKESGAAAVERLSWRLTSLCLGGTVVYWIAFLTLEHPVLHLLYGGRYVEVTYLIPWIALGSVFRMATVVQMVSLKAIQSPFLGFVAFVVSDIGACLIGIPAIWAFGLQGAILTYVLSGAMGLIASFSLLRSVARGGGTKLLRWSFPATASLAESQGKESSVSAA